MHRVKLGTLARIIAKPDLATEQLFKIAASRAPDPSVFEQVTPFFWQVRASSNRLDFYDTRMRPETTLENFARAFGEGVSYQDSHNTRKNGWGQSLTGYTVKSGERDAAIDAEIVEVWAELFTLPGLDLAGQSTDSFIDAIRAGIWRDVSVGFYASDIECSICGQQSFQWWKEDGCQHIPGYTYTFQGQEARAFAWINDGEVVELSQVYKGASPSAAVVKGSQMSEAGQLSAGERAFIERRHGVRITEHDRLWTSGSARSHTAHKEQSMTKEQDIETPMTSGSRSTIERALTRAAELGMAIPQADQPIGERVVALVDALEAATAERSALTTDLAEERAARETAHAEIERLRPLADDGASYRTHLTDDTIAAGARAFGTDFREEVYRGILAKLDIDGIRAMKDDFSRKGDELFAGSRNTRDTEEEPVEQERKIDPARHKG